MAVVAIVLEAGSDMRHIEHFFTTVTELNCCTETVLTVPSYCTTLGTLLSPASCHHHHAADERKGRTLERQEQKVQHKEKQSMFSTVFW